MKYITRPQLAVCVVAAWLAAAPGASAAEPALGKEAYAAARQHIEAQHDAQTRACRRVKGHARELCEAEADAREEIAEALLEARREPGPQADKEAKFVKADADYDVARVRCEAVKADKARKACVRKARADREAAIRQAKVEKVESLNAEKAKAEAERKRARKAVAG